MRTGWNATSGRPDVRTMGACGGDHGGGGRGRARKAKGQQLQLHSKSPMIRRGKGRVDGVVGPASIGGSISCFVACRRTSTRRACRGAAARGRHSVPAPRPKAPTHGGERSRPTAEVLMPDVRADWDWPSVVARTHHPRCGSSELTDTSSEEILFISAK